MPDSRLVTNSAQPTAPDTSQAISLPKQPVTGLMSNWIPVKAGDSVSISAMVLDNIPHKSRFWKSLAKAVVPAFILSNLGKDKPAIAGDQPLKAGNVTTFGVSMAVIPGAIDLVRAQKKAKTFVSLAVYDANHQPVAVFSDVMTKAARKDWEELRVGYRVEKDGFVEITGNKNNADGLSVETYGKNYWIKAGITSYHKNEDIVPDPIDTGNDPSVVSDSIDTGTSPAVIPHPINPGNPSSAVPDSIDTGNPPIVPDSSGIGNPLPIVPDSLDTENTPQHTQSAGQTCTAWYWVDGGGWSFLGITCEDNIDYGNIPNGGGAGSNNPDSDALGQCSQNLNTALDRCLQNFAIQMAAVAAMGEAPPAAIVVLINARVHFNLSPERM